MRTFRCRARSVVFIAVSFVSGFLLISIFQLLKIDRNSMPIIIYQNVLASEPTLVRVIRQKNITVPMEVYNLKDKIADMARKLYKAKKHVRGIKTADNLKEAIYLLEGILDDLNIDTEPLKQRASTTAQSICPEEYKGTTYGYPFFYKGFEVKNCNYAIPISNLVTITAQIKENPKDNIEKVIDNFLLSVHRLNPKLRVVLAGKVSFSTVQTFTKRFPNLIFRGEEATKGLSEGKIWNSLVEEVTTKYVLVARNVEIITVDSRFDRLIREIESMELEVAGGAFRAPNGHWSNGCYQVAYKNYSLSYHYGYDESVHECLICDYIEGPFIATKSALEKIIFKNLDETEGLFEDWFLRLHMYTKQESVGVCPDSMFYTFFKPPDKEIWSSFMKDWELYRLRTPLGKEIYSLCHGEVLFKNSKAVSPCALKILADAINFLMATCEDAGIICELEEGTALGAVKLNKILPWERDADVTFLTTNYSAFKQLAEKFATINYRLISQKEPWCCVDNRTAGGIFQLYLTGWHIEIYGQHMMDSELLMLQGVKPTKILHDGQWVNVPRNPGLFMRNRYGHEIYRHALHWMSLGEKTGWVNYKTSKFLTCEQPGHHACIDRFNTDGNIQFQAWLP